MVAAWHPWGMIQPSRRTIGACQRRDWQIIRLYAVKARLVTLAGPEAHQLLGEPGRRRRRCKQHGQNPSWQW
jgi:hypothetical protein